MNQDMNAETMNAECRTETTERVSDVQGSGVGICAVRFEFWVLRFGVLHSFCIRSPLPIIQLGSSAAGTPNQLQGLVH
jgi:hypothetical protein